MNKKRRAEISNIIKELNGLKDRIETVLSEEENYFENIPENLETSTRAEESEDAIESLEDASSDLESCIDSLTEI